MTSSAIVSVSLGLLLAGCSNATQSQGPSNSEVTERPVPDAQACRGMFVRGEQAFPISIVSAKPVAQSVEGNAATVIVEVQFRSTESGWGNSPQRPCEDFNNKGPGTLALTRVKMKFKQYDTGWLFERYEHEGDIFQ
jgi:hypothetical protein